MDSETQQLEINYHPLIRPHVELYCLIVASLMGWKLMTEKQFDSLLLARGIEKCSQHDSVGLASEALRRDSSHSLTKFSFIFSNRVRSVISEKEDHPALMRIAGQQLLGHCYEVLKGNEPINPRGNPVGEFLRHVRNGCYHGNRFNFLHDEPKYHAEWRGLVIDKSSLQGTHVLRHSLADKGFFLNHGDVPVLLSDVSALVPV